MAGGMTPETPDNPPAPTPAATATRGEPPLIERARRTGWLLLMLCVAAMAVARLGPESVRPWAVGTAIGLGLIGLLAIINVALVRGLYVEIGKARDAAEAAEGAAVADDGAERDGASTGSA